MKKYIAVGFYQNILGEYDSKEEMDESIEDNQWMICDWYTKEVRICQ